jgi:valine--pyruvate aminotransferase
MAMSSIGQKMARMSGLRSIMEDISTSTARSEAGEWLNLSIGNPARIPEVVATWQAMMHEALADDFADAACQYGPSRGSHAFIEAVAGYFRRHYGWDVAAENIIVGTGSQMLCFIASAMFAGPGHPGNARVVMPVQPDYTGYQGLCMTPGGVAGVSSLLQEVGDRYFRYVIDVTALERRDDIGLMLVSSPSNPAGRSLDQAELARLIGIAERADAPLLIDHAYGEPFPRIAETLTPPVSHPNVINSFSLSKAGLPGERIGFAIGHERYITPMVSFLANSSLHASRLAQAAAARGLRSSLLDELVSSVIMPFYERRRELAEALLLDCMPADVRWRMHTGRGGMFCWVWIDEDWFDDLELYHLLKADRVFITPGGGFFADPGAIGPHARQCFRISLTTAEGILAEGIKRIADAVASLRTGRGAPR